MQVRKGIRDAFDADDATVKESLKTLNTTTGYDMNIQICKQSATIKPLFAIAVILLYFALAWVDIWNALQPKFVDSKESFVPSVTDGESQFTQ